jgi:Zn-dependent metalloprotease
MSETTRRSVNCFLPPHLLKQLIERATSDRQRRELTEILIRSERLRGNREITAALGNVGSTPPGTRRRTIYDAKNDWQPSGVIVRTEGSDSGKADADANAAYDNLGFTYDFLLEVFERNSLDGNGSRLDAIVHFGDHYANALWNGSAMLFGDGDGQIFSSLSQSLDVTAHELGHGVVQSTAGLEYHGQSGALNESYADVIGTLVKQWRWKQDVTQADWLIGADVFTPGTVGDALRSLKSPGDAYAGDPQPKHMDHYDDTGDDAGGVHTNSGIPNHAFYLFATALGGNAWDVAGRVWYQALIQLFPTATFEDCALATCSVARDRYGAQAGDAARQAWDTVGVKVSGGLAVSSMAAMPRLAEASLRGVVERVEQLERELNALKRQLR